MIELTACKMLEIMGNLKKSGVPYSESEMHKYIRRWGSLVLAEVRYQPMQWPELGKNINQGGGLALGNILQFGGN